MRPISCERRRWLRLTARLPSLLLLAALLPACASLTVAEENQLGAQIAQEMRAELLFLRDKETLDYVRNMGDAIVRAAGPQPFAYHFEVVEDDEINAFTAPAGYVYVNTGTILHARNASELAAVLAHEIGHVVYRHVAENYERRRGTGTLLQAGVLAASVFGFGGLADLGGGLAAMMVLNSFSRSDELEADAFAVEVLPRAGYDPKGLLTFLDVVRTSGGGAPPAFLSSHPATDDRISQTTALIDSQPPTPGLRVTDRGRFEIIRRRIEILTRKGPPQPEPAGRVPL
jgi:predicted Zn-dependent protease